MLRTGRQASSLPVGPMLAFETLMPLQPFTGYMLRLEIFTVSAIVKMGLSPHPILVRNIKPWKERQQITTQYHPWQHKGLAVSPRQSYRRARCVTEKFGQPGLSFYPMSSSAGEQASPHHRAETDRLAQRE